MWVHGSPNILLNCYTQHAEPTDDPDNEGGEEFDLEKAMAMQQAVDPYDERLKPISDDKNI
jgi:hypothetical protein